MTTGAASKPPSPRRRPGEVRDAIVTAATQLFAENGYARTTTRDIASAAGVADSQLFRHFSNKSDLFREAILAPFTEYFVQYRHRWEQQLGAPVSTEELIRIFVEGLYDFLRKRRDLMLALLEANHYDSDALGDVDFGLGDLLAEHERLIAHEVSPRDLSQLDIPVTIRATVAMITGMAVFDDWLFPRGRRRPSRQRIIDEMVAICQHGVEGRPS